MAATISSLLSVHEVCSTTCQTRSTLHEAVRRGDFPAPVRVGTRRIAWRSEDVQRWIESRPLAVNSREAA
jgi:prophage regulatory protein